MKPKSNKRKKPAEPSPEPGVVLVKQTKEYKEKRGKKETDKTKDKKKKSGGKKTKGRKDKMAMAKIGGADQNVGSKNELKKHNKAKQKSSGQSRQRPSGGRKPPPPHLPPPPAPPKPPASDHSSKKFSKQRKISKDRKVGKHEKDRQANDVGSDKKKHREKKIRDGERKTSIKKPPSTDKKHWIEEEFLEPGKDKLEKKEEKKIDDGSLQTQPPSIGHKVEEQKPAPEAEQVNSTLTYLMLPSLVKGTEPRTMKPSVAYPTIPSPPKEHKPPPPKKESKKVAGELYGVRPEKPDAFPQKYGIRPEKPEVVPQKPPSPPLQATQCEDVVSPDRVKTTMVTVSPAKESMPPQISRHPVGPIDSLRMPSSSITPLPAFPSQFKPTPVPVPAQKPTQAQAAVLVEMPPPPTRPSPPAPALQPLPPMPPPPPPAPPLATLQQPVPDSLRVNIDEILRLGAIMERRGLNTEKKMSFEWIALNRHIIYQQPEAFAAHLVTAVGDVRIEKSLACDALNVLMYQRTISPDEYLRLCQQAENLQPITIAILAQLLRTNTKFYSSPRNIQPILRDQRY